MQDIPSEIHRSFSEVEESFNMSSIGKGFREISKDEYENDDDLGFDVY